MISRALGQISIQIAFFLYLGMLLPQVIHNLRRNSTVGLSWFMQLLMMASALCDFGYGVGLDMPWQYWSVSIGVLIIVGLQHGQFYFYRREARLHSYGAATTALVILFAIIGLSFRHRLSHAAFYTALGYVSMVGWLICTVPQIVTNWKIKNTAGLSLSFVLIGVAANICDTISAYGLNFAWPNKIGAPSALLFKAVLLTQFLRYRRSAAP